MLQTHWVSYEVSRQKHWSPVSNKKIDPLTLRYIRKTTVHIPWKIHKLVGKQLALNEEITTMSSNIAYGIRVAVHCGRCIQSPWKWVTQTIPEQNDSEILLKMKESIGLEHVPEDSLVAIIIELVAALVEVRHPV